jgi:hypothetical protein
MDSIGKPGIGDVFKVEREGAASRYTPAGSLRISGDDTQMFFLEFSPLRPLERSRRKSEVTVETTHKTYSVKIPERRFFEDPGAIGLQQMHDLLRAQREQSKGGNAAGPDER